MLLKYGTVLTVKQGPIHLTSQENRTNQSQRTSPEVTGDVNEVKRGGGSGDVQNRFEKEI